MKGSRTLRGSTADRLVAKVGTAACNILAPVDRSRQQAADGSTSGTGLALHRFTAAEDAMDWIAVRIGRLLLGARRTVGLWWHGH